MLGTREINRLINGIVEYNNLLEKSGLVRDRLEETTKAWEILLAGRDALREEADRMHQAIARFKEDFQEFHTREVQWMNRVSTLHVLLQFLIDEFDAILSRHRRKRSVPVR